MLTPPNIQPLEDSVLPCLLLPPHWFLPPKLRPPPAARSQHQANQIPDRGWSTDLNPVSLYMANIVPSRKKRERGDAEQFRRSSLSPKFSL
ncbi:hypothetical protein TNCV_2661511 [Trichonephila clavipes]|nr:hypothetical protein TNCV_2661511 [Trichonephila clavipes]